MNMYQEQKIAVLMEVNARLRAELAALREPTGDLVEVAARILFENTAKKVQEIGVWSDWEGQDNGWYRDARAVLDAVLPRVRAEGWLPIESAPRDELVLTHGEDGACVAYLNSGCWRQPYKTYHDDVDPDGVTHWRPLPPPPDAAP